MAMDSRAREVLRMGTALFGQKRSLDTLFQEIALHFYPERANFTTTRNIGAEYADHLVSSYPLLARRELGNMLSSNLRPQSRKWFSIHATDEGLDEVTGVRKYLEHITDVQWRAMYESRAGFVRATKQADHDFSAFGNAVIYAGLNSDRDGLLYINYHLRDCAWSENAERRIDIMHRQWEPTARQLKQLFPNTIPKEVVRACEKEPEQTFKCRHAVLPSRVYDYKSKNGRKFPFVALMIECGSETVLEEVGLTRFPYIVPRWQTVSDSVYGRSMATEIALPDGRTLQTVVATIREAGEKYVNPPMVAIEDAIRGDIALMAGGVSIASYEYDERTGEVLRPLTQDKGTFPISFDIAAALQEDLRNAFFLDKLQLPEIGGNDMTAFEVRRRIEERLRSASPLFEPVEAEYSTPLCELTFELLTDLGAFPREEMPSELSGADIKYTFQSPLSEMADEAEMEAYIDVLGRVIVPTMQLDPAQVANFDLTLAARDAAKAGGWKAKWFRDMAEVAEKQAEQQRARELAMGIDAIQQTGAAAEAGGRGLASIKEAL